VNFGRYIVLQGHTHTPTHHCMIRLRCCFTMMSVSLISNSSEAVVTDLYHIWSLPAPKVYNTYFPWSSSCVISYKSLKVLTSVFKDALHLLIVFHKTWQRTFLQILAIYVWILSIFSCIMNVGCSHKYLSFSSPANNNHASLNLEIWAAIIA